MPEFYEPLLNLSDPEHHNSMGAVLSLRDPVDGEMLRCAVEEMRARFPYFYVKPAYRGDGLITVPNDLPMTVRNTWEPIRFHSEASNYHLGAWKCQDRRVAFVRHLNRSAFALRARFIRRPDRFLTDPFPEKGI